MTDSRFSGKITTKRVVVSSSHFSSIGGLIGYTAQGIAGGSVDCVIDAQGDANLYCGGVIGVSGPDTWTGLTVKADVSAVTPSYCGLLIGGATGEYTVKLGNATDPISISKSSKLQGTTIKGDGSDALTGKPEMMKFTLVNLVYVD